MAARTNRKNRQQAATTGVVDSFTEAPPWEPEELGHRQTTFSPERKGGLITEEVADAVVGGLRRENNETKYRGMINRGFKNIELARQRMTNDQVEIDRLRIETRALIAELLT